MFGTSLKRARGILVYKCVSLLSLALLVAIAGCSSQKGSGFHNAMQNLTAHYNILFNAKELLRQKQVSYATSFIDNYSEVLSVYQDTTAQNGSLDKDLDAATHKANYLINEKDDSKYIGDAYLVLGQANYLEGNFFNAVEYFSYVIRSFPQRKDLVREARAWETRTLIYLNQLPQAKPVIDSAIAHIDPKKHKPADVYAAKLAYDIATMDYVDGEEMAKNAVQYCHEKSERTRWLFILAQLEELNNQLPDAYKNYAHISRSNVLFEMAFNASLNMIRIKAGQSDLKTNREAALMALLKNPNNAEFKDQIYYQVAQLQLANKQVDDAIKNYNRSIRNSLKNQTQKGLAYLRLAEIYFDNKNDYVKSKKYYDSTLTTLPVTYPGYATIKKKGSNLALLADRLQIIAREDTLQSLAKMDEKTRLAIIDKMVSDYVLQQQNEANAAKANAAALASASQANSFSGGSFYFDNAGAVGQGAADFKKKWGARKLEDDWRRSQRSASDVTGNSSSSIQGNDPDAAINGVNSARSASGAAAYRKSLMDGLPLTPALLAQSNQRLYNAYVDIGDFYRDVLEDKKAAIKIFETILDRFPNDQNRPAIYYNLYRLYGDIDPKKSDFYKDKLLREYPETPFAKIISDPDFIKKLGDKDAEYASAYNALFDLYTQKKYKEVISSVPELLKQYPGSRYSAQLFYLQTLSQGHFETIGPFTDSLKRLMAYYPMDKLVVPLVKQHLAFINNNADEMATRSVVLADADPHDIPFTLAIENKERTNYLRQPRSALPPQPKQALPQKTGQQNQAAARQKQPAPATPVSNAPAIAAPSIAQAAQAAKTGGAVNAAQTSTPVGVSTTGPPNGNQAIVQQNSTPTPVTSNTPASPPPGITQSAYQPKSEAIDPDRPVNNPAAAAIPSIFSKLDSTNYYFVVNVTSGSVNLASSRFGIGQFNRANYAGQGIRHQLKAVGDTDQVIYVGVFNSISDAKHYARQIVPLLPDIMKVPAAKYSFFIITKENLDKLADEKTLNSYIEYYQNNY
jgi:tetratricopeptide (TPR) repeat protein